MYNSQTQNKKVTDMTIKYRPDIDGLRAIAVLSVVVFHYFPAALPGGFVGVDIFFVISGYLIGTIIYRDIKEQSFSFKEFYIRRALRIFPALIVVLSFCFWFGWQTLYKDEMAALGKHIASGAGFISNLVSWSESGYFDKDSAVKPLLHLWSLGVEEQFYLIIPILMIASSSVLLSIRNVAVVTLLASFLYCLWSMVYDPTANYYSPLSRFWELMAGVLLAIHSVDGGKLVKLNHNANNIMSALGLITLALSITFINENMLFPGYIASMPVIGSMLIIAAGPSAIVNRHILSLSPVVFVGLISYPLYLWHWPLISFARIIHGEAPSAEVSFIAMTSAFILSVGTYYLIERPIRFGIKLSKPSKAVALTTILGAILGLGVYTYNSNGLSDRFFVKENSGRDSAFDGGDPNLAVRGCQEWSQKQKDDIPICMHDKRGPSSYGLIGDSKSMALYPGLMRTTIEGKYWTYAGGNKTDSGRRTATVPVLTDDPLYQIYQAPSKAALDVLANNKDIKFVVYVVATRAIFQLSRDYHINDLPTTKNYDVAYKGLMVGVDKLISSGKKVVLVVDNPTLPHPEDCMVRKTGFDFINNMLVKENKNCSISLDKHRNLSAIYLRLLNDIKQNHPNKIYIFDMVPLLCENGTCGQTKDGRYLYGSTDHISDYASGIVGKELNKFLNNL
ncbi:TPA: acyltransferase [Escherichia coli]|nr:acyltransferase [Escherichia coli]